MARQRLCSVPGAKQANTSKIKRNLLKKIKTEMNT
jgi:hypothetical protein